MRASHYIASGMLRAAAGLAALAVGTSPASAQGEVPAWPQRAIKLIIPFPPGGAADTIGRVLATELSATLGQTVVPENRPGAGTAIAAEAAARAAPDGYTLSLATTGQLTILPALRRDLPYDPVRSFAPVGLVAQVAYVVSVSSAEPARSLKDLLEQAKRHRDAVSYSSCGSGTVCHLTGELLNSVTGVKLLHVPFSGSAPAIQAVLGRHVQLAVDTAAVQAPHIRSGALRPLAISSNERSPALPDVPTGAQAGYPDFVSTSWFGVVAPAGTPEPIIARLNAALQRILAQDRVRQSFDNLGLTTLGGTPQAFSEQIQADLKKWGAVVAQAAVKLE